MIALGSDHAGLPLKKEIIALLEEMHLPYHDYGTYTGDSCDYAVFAQRAAKAVVSGECDCAVLPIENSYAGEVGQVTDMLFSGTLYINGVYVLPVNVAL